MPAVPSLRMNDGRQIPQLGLGVFQIPQDETADVVTTAIDAGYRLIDTAAGYANEEGVGEAIRRSGVPRDELFITTKLANGDQGYDNAMRAFDTSLTKLGLDQIDLYLIHWPIPQRDLYVETWRALENLRTDGRARSIGVSNFTEAHLQRLFDETGTVPVLNQIELHPWFSQPGLRTFHAENGILTQAWSPLGQNTGLLEEPVIAELAARHDVTPAQVVLRWHVQLGNVVIPKSVNPERIVSNIAVFGFDLTDDDLAALAQLDTGRRIGPDPLTFGA